MQIVCSLIFLLQMNAPDIPAPSNVSTADPDSLLWIPPLLVRQTNTHRDCQIDRNHSVWMYQILPVPPVQTCSVEAQSQETIPVQKHLIPTITQDTWLRQATQDIHLIQILKGTVCMPLVHHQGSLARGSQDRRVITGHWVDPRIEVKVKFVNLSMCLSCLLSYWSSLSAKPVVLR